MRIKSTKRFDKMYKKTPIYIQESFLKRIKLFEKNKYHPLLDNHALSGVLKKYRSINISGDYRAIFKEIEKGTVMCFIMTGTHSQLYG